MSKANGAIENKDTFLQHVSLKNYKSIKDIEIDFKPGLNVIIGKNASGKTNFLNGLDAILDSKHSKLLDTQFLINAWFEGDKVEIIASKKQQLKNNGLKKSHNNYSIDHDIALKLNDKKINIALDDEHFLYYFDQVLIKYKIPYGDNAQFISSPSSFVLVNNGEISNSGFTEIFSVDNKSRFITDLFNRFWEDIIISYWGANIQETINQDWRKEILPFFERHLKTLQGFLFRYSPIADIRLNPDFNIIKQDGGEKQTITNFYLEFLIDEIWLPFNLLSDGTKRLFYIISEILSWRTYNDPIVKTDLNIILLEEPELGIHPHQLHQLMEFIKEQSKKKQIIITTHSPQVLDALEPDELDRIIICHSEPKTGTQLSHLTEQQIKKAKKYMNSEAFLSDYWRFSDLEPA